ncbi:hypothetical protein [Streptomyces sp. CAU 1734]|uniref:hypothetical protein n=1 Tax=Streptomyces sp. CAU 1734 TaxID=3140360 RepID=UPI00325FEBEF
MCATDRAAKDAAIARFTGAYPRAADAGAGHPALHGCENVRWPAFPGCPAAIPVILRALADRTAASEAQRVLVNSLFDSVTEMNAAVPEVLPFLLRLAGDERLPGRSGLLDCLVEFAESAEPVGGDDEIAVLWLGSDSDHPEREGCRAVFADHARAVAMLPEGLITAGGRATLRRAAGLD